MDDGGESIGIVIEVKYPDSERLEAGCSEALEQIERMEYATRLRQNGMNTIIKYGIACNKKSCKVQCGRLNTYSMLRDIMERLKTPHHKNIGLGE